MELCVKALQLPRQDDSETRILVCKTVLCLLTDDLEVLRACKLTEFLLGPNKEAFTCLRELYSRPDQKYDQENEVIPNSLRCELLLALKAYWPFDPEFWDWNTLKYHCITLFGWVQDLEGEDNEAEGKEERVEHEPLQFTVKVEPELQNRINGSISGRQQQISSPETPPESEVKLHKFACQICKRAFSDTQIIHHSKRHANDSQHPCPVCLKNFESRQKLINHLNQHLQGEIQPHTNSLKKQNVQNQVDEDDDVEPGEINVDPSLMLYYKSTHDPDVLQHIVQQAKTVKEKRVDDDEHITFDYINQHFTLQNRDEYPCPGTGCTRVFKHSKYLYVHLKSDHNGDENVKHFQEMRDRREKCLFCKRHFVSHYHHRKHRRVHFGDRPYLCVIVDCGAQFKTSNELVMHKQTHGYQVSYQCELEGCSVACSDLGQVYHHEAQHFREAAFTCSSGDCKKFYLSKKEFITHLSTHNLTFSEEDFEAQRKAKRKLYKASTDGPARLKKCVDSKEVLNGLVLKSATVSSVSSPGECNKEPKATMTLVAVCFDGSKFTCGFEKCGMTFSRARDVQRHLKGAHAEYLKLENREHDLEKEVNTELEPEDEEKGKVELFTSCPPMQTSKEQEAAAPPKPDEENSNSSLHTNNDTLNDIIIRLSELNLNCSSPNLVLSECTPESDALVVALHQAIIAKPVVLQKTSTDLPEENVEMKTEQASTAEVLATAKPYVCQMKSCDFRTAQSYSLQRHYCTRHGRTMEQAKRMTSLKTTSFKPYHCQLCSKSHRQKNVLRAHYIHVHKLSSRLIDRLSFGSVQDGGKKNAEENLSKHSASQGIRMLEKVFPEMPDHTEEENSNAANENGENCESPFKEEGLQIKTEIQKEENETNGECEKTTQQVRSTRRLVARSNHCYVLDKFSKPYHCVAKSCDAAFSTQGGLVRHLQLVHHYNRSQLLLEKDLEVNQSHELRKEPVKKRLCPNFDEPQPRFKCHFAKCSATYHLKSSLLRHIRDIHSQPTQILKCKYEGCKRVFTHNYALKKHTLYDHCEYYDSLVVRLQSTHKKSVTGCQKKVIITPSSQNVEPNSETSQNGRSSPEPEINSKEEETEETCKLNIEGKNMTVPKSKPKRNSLSSFVFRSHEEALQMCQDRCMRVAYPCMIQDCDSVVSYVHSLNRHYIRVHRMRREDIYNSKLVFNAEQLEELIQKKSARPTMAGAGSPNDVSKMESPPELEKKEGEPVPTGLQSAKSETQDENDCHPMELPRDREEELPTVETNGVLVGADEVLYGEPRASDHTEDTPASPHNGLNQEDRLNLDKIKQFLRPLTVDLSPPCSLRFTTDQGFQDPKINGSATNPALPVRQPLKRKNELPEQPSNVKDAQGCNPPNSFNIEAYKPIGFEASFLKFIQDTNPKDKNTTKRKDAFRRSCSVKENNQMGISHTRNKRTYSPLPKPHISTRIQNLKSILDKALAGCGDLAIKQLQYLRPVVVLGRPVSPTTTLSDLFPSDNSNKLLLGS